MTSIEAKEAFAPQWTPPDVSTVKLGRTQLTWSFQAATVILTIDKDSQTVSIAHNVRSHPDIVGLGNPLDMYVSDLTTPSIARERMDKLWDAIQPMTMWQHLAPTEPATRD